MEQMQLGERKVIHVKLDTVYTFLLLDVFGELSMMHAEKDLSSTCFTMAQFLPLLLGSGILTRE